MIFIFIVAFDPNHVIDKKILDQYDKVKHIMAFLVLSYFLFESSIRLHDFFKFLILVSLALSIEYNQGMIGREFSILDFLASSLGIVLFMVIKFFAYRL